MTDITHYLDDDGELPAEMPGPARKLASFLVLVIDAASQDIPADERNTSIRCRQDGCTGSIRASLTSIDDEISWSCLTVVDEGNWAPDAGMKRAVFPASTARYVRVDVLDANGEQAIVAELEVGAYSAPPESLDESVGP